jgi:hypothetical protein
LGFLSDKTDPRELDEALFTANYSVAPYIVENTTDRHLLLADFADSSHIEAVLQRYRLRVSEDFGNGFFLLEHRP